MDYAPDKDLLLLAHRALPLWTRLRLQGHLLHCGVCHTRMMRVTQNSALIASAVRGPTSPPWSQADAVSRAGPRPALWNIWNAVILGLTLILFLCATGLLIINHESAARAASAVTCR